VGCIDIGECSLKLTYRFLKYCLVGTITTLEGWSIVWFLTEIPFKNFDWLIPNYILSSIIGTPIVIASAFALNNWWTWGKNNDREVEWLKRLLLK
jgi:putative flippase GtrA